MRRIGYLVGIIGALSLPGVSWGNGAPPPKAYNYLHAPDMNFEAEPKHKVLRSEFSVPMRIIYRQDARAKWVVPKKYAMIDGGPLRKAAVDDAPGTPRTLLAGIALSGAFVAGGLWFLRRSSPSAGKTALAAMVIVASLASPFLADLCSNEAAPPRLGDKKLPPQTWNMQGGQQAVQQQVDIEIVEEGHEILLVLPKIWLPTHMLPTDLLVPSVGRGSPKLPDELKKE